MTTDARVTYITSTKKKEGKEADERQEKTSYSNPCSLQNRFKHERQKRGRETVETIYQPNPCSTGV